MMLYNMLYLCILYALLISYPFVFTMIVTAHSIPSSCTLPRTGGHTPMWSSDTAASQATSSHARLVSLKCFSRDS